MYSSRSSLQTSSSMRAMTSGGGSPPSARTSSTASSFTYWLHSRAMSLSVIFLICTPCWAMIKTLHEPCSSLPNDRCHDTPISQLHMSPVCHPSNLHPLFADSK